MLLSLPLAWALIAQCGAGQRAQWNRAGLEADAQGRHEEALAAFEHALGCAGSEGGATRARALQNVAAAHHRLGSFARAEHYYRESLAAWAASGGESEADAGRVWQNLASVLRARANAAGAVAAARRAAGILDAAGAPRASRANAWFEVAEAERAAARIDRALEANRRGRAEAPPDEPVAVARLMEQEALLRFESGDPAAALALEAEAQEIFARHLDPVHRHIAAAHSNRAQIEMALGNAAAAEESLRRALFIAWSWPRRSLVEAAAANNLAQLLRAQARYAEAEPLYRRALDLFGTLLGPAHPDTAKALYNLAGLFVLQGKLRGAEKLYAAALDASESALGAAHPQTRQISDALAHLDHGMARAAGSGRLARHLRPHPDRKARQSGE